MAQPIFPEEMAYTFAEYFKMNVDIEDLLAHFGYRFQSHKHDLPHTSHSLDRLAELSVRIGESLPYLSLSSDIARREFLIAPIIIDVVHYTHAKVKVEYPLNVSDQLKGTLDYYLRARTNLLIVEAKNADIQKGFTQLAVELIALDAWIESETPTLYGAVSMGSIWQFGILDRQRKEVIQDLNLFRVPADLEELLRILVGILLD